MTDEDILKAEEIYNRYLEMEDNFRVANDEIERLNNIIKEARDFIKGKDLKEKEYRFAEDFDFAKLLEILDKGE